MSLEEKSMILIGIEEHRLKLEGIVSRQRKEITKLLKLNHLITQQREHYFLENKKLQAELDLLLDKSL